MNICKILVIFSFGFVAVEDAFAFDGCFVKPRLNVTVDVRAAGAVGDGVTNDTKAFQKALDRVALTGGTVTVSKGTYMIDAVVGVQIKSNTNLLLTKDSYIRAIPNNSRQYSIIKIINSNNVTIVGGNLIGDRAEHQGTQGEWGMGISIKGANNVIVKEVVSRDNWGDGFYISDGSKNIDFCSVTADGNRRQGMSIISGDNIAVIDSVFKNTNGTKPEAGIDIEPDQGDSVRGVRITGSKFLNNLGPGVMSYVAPGNRKASIDNIIIEDNIMMKNGAGGGVVFNTSNVKIISNIFVENERAAINFGQETKNGIIERNVIYRKKSGGREILDSGNNSIVGNYFR